MHDAQNIGDYLVALISNKYIIFGLFMQISVKDYILYFDGPGHSQASTLRINSNFFIFSAKNNKRFIFSVCI